VRLIASERLCAVQHEQEREDRDQRRGNERTATMPRITAQDGPTRHHR